MNLKYYLRGLGIGIIVSVIIMFVISLQSDNNSMTDEEIIQRARELGMVEASETLASINTGVTANNGESDGSEDLGETTDSESSADEAATVEPPENEFLDGVEQQLDEAEQQLEEIRNKDNGTGEVSENTSAASDGEVKETASDSQAEEKKEESSKPEDKPKDTNKEETSTETNVEENNIENNSSSENKNNNSNKDVVVLKVNRGDNSYDICKKLQALGIVNDAKSYDSYLCRIGLDRYIYAGEYSIPKGSSDEEIAFLLTGKRG